MAETLTRGQMADEMEENGNARVAEWTGASWRRVSVLVAEQRSCAYAGQTDFHTLELCTGGKAQSQAEMEAETGDRLDVTKVAGCMHFLPAHSPIACEIDGQHSIQHVFIDDSIFRDAAEAITPGDPCAIKPLGFGGIFDPRIKLLADALLDEARIPSAGGEIYADAVATQLALMVLRRRYDTPKTATRRRMLSPAELARVTDHLEADLAETGGIDTLAELIDMEKFAFIRAFKETTGQAPHQFLIDRRMARIKNKLLHSNETLANIAYATGFSSQAHMTSAFAKRVGNTPGKWRDAAKGVTAP